MNMEKLPLWAQKHIEKLQRERDTAVSELRKYIDEQTPAPFKFSAMESIGERVGPSFLDRYVQARSVEITHGGIVVDVSLRDDNVTISWGKEDHRLCGDVNMQPVSFQQIRLSSPK